MATWVLIGYSTEEHGEHGIRHREYTSSARTAALFAQIPRIQFTDSGHGVCFDALPHSGKRKPVRRMEYVYEHMARLRAEARKSRTLATASDEAAAEFADRVRRP